MTGWEGTSTLWVEVPSPGRAEALLRRLGRPAAAPVPRVRPRVPGYVGAVPPPPAPELEPASPERDLRLISWFARRCPKQMRHGPCGGVQAEGWCEVPGVVCPFPQGAGPVPWTGPGITGAVPRLPLVLVDLRPDPAQPDEARAASDLLARAGTGALIGDHLDDSTPHPPSVVASLLAPLLPVVSTVACRGRSRVELEAEVDAVWAAGVRAVHCVTGDHPRSRLHLAQDPVFGADSMELTAWAAGRGVTASVAESPAAPPEAWRPLRVGEKVRAGAGLVILNHAGPVDRLIGFVDACRAFGVTVPFVAPVPVVSDHRSAASLRRFPGLVLPPGLLDAVLGAADPVAAGIEAAIEIGRRLLGSGRFAGVNLSGSASGGSLQDRARIMAKVAEELVA